MSAVRNCGCDEISDSDASKYDSNRHYFTCHLFKFDTLQASVKEENQVNILDVNTTLDDLVTNIEVVDSSIDLNTMFNAWMSKVLDNEAGRTSELNNKITESLSRQLEDGLITYYEYVDMQYIGGIWIKLLLLIKLYNLGCMSIKKDIVSLLMELFELKQISKNLLIETILQL